MVTYRSLEKYSVETKSTPGRDMVIITLLMLVGVGFVGYATSVGWQDVLARHGWVLGVSIFLFMLLYIGTGTYRGIKKQREVRAALKEFAHDNSWEYREYTDSRDAPDGIGGPRFEQSSMLPIKRTLAWVIIGKTNKPFQIWYMIQPGASINLGQYGRHRYETYKTYLGSQVKGSDRWTYTEQIPEGFVLNPHILQELIET